MSSGIIVREVEHGGRKMFQLDIPAKLNNGKRSRKLFEDESGALAKMDEHMRILREHGQRGLQAEGLTVKQGIRRFRALKQMDGRHKETARSIHDQFAKKYGSHSLRLISPVDLQAFWMNEEWSPTTRVKAFRYIRLLFNWLERYDLIDRNPARRVEPPKDDDPPKHILTPTRVTSLLAINDDILRAFICLGAFAGIRSSEIQALKPDDIEESEIRVNAGTKDERWVARLPVFDFHWKALPDFGCTDFLYRHLREVTGGLPSNCMRHSFGSYHLAMWEDAGKTAFQMGNSAAIVMKSYARAVRKAQAISFWGIGLPANVEHFTARTA